jgi:hypothetical protein
MTIKKTWRDDPGLIFEVEYKKKFAWLPVLCNGETKKTWLKTYYAQYFNWGHSYLQSKVKTSMYEPMYHQEFISNITEEEYIIRKIADTL